MTFVDQLFGHHLYLSIASHSSQQRLWKLETSRLLQHFTQFSKEELEDDDLWVIEENQEETKVSKTSPAEYAYLLRFPLLEILKYPYLMAHPQLSEFDTQPPIHVNVLF